MAFDEDGTQPARPMPAFEDPLAGLVTGAAKDTGDTPTRAGDADRLDIASPVEPDPEVVREMVDAALRGDLPPGEFAPAPEAATERTAEQALPNLVPSQRPGEPAPPVGMLPRAQARSRRRSPRGTRRPKLNSSSGGVILAVVLLLVFGVLVVQFFVTFIDSIASIFD